MASSIQQYSRLTAFLLRHGHLKPQGKNFNLEREESLKPLKDFIPEDYSFSGSGQTSIFRNLIGQLAYVEGSFRTTGGHLTAGSVSYIRIPKAASTSVSKIMLEKKYPDLTRKAPTEKQINFLTDVNLEYELKNSLTVFTLVRNPFSRLVSVYRDFFENPNNFIYHDYLFGIFTPEISFSEFVDRLIRIPHRLKDQHVRPQHVFLKYYEDRKIKVNIFKLEDSEALNRYLAEFSLQLPHLNKSKEPYDYRAYYNTSIFEKVREIYADDIALLGYETSCQELKNQLKTVH